MQESFIKISSLQTYSSRANCTNTAILEYPNWCQSSNCSKAARELSHTCHLKNYRQSSFRMPKVIFTRWGWLCMRLFSGFIHTWRRKQKMPRCTWECLKLPNLHPLINFSEEFIILLWGLTGLSKSFREWSHWKWTWGWVSTSWRTSSPTSSHSKTWRSRYKTKWARLRWTNTQTTSRLHTTNNHGFTWFPQTTNNKTD